jgi:hypothetical protein
LDLDIQETVVYGNGMKINIDSINREELLVKDVLFQGIDAILVQPNHIGTRFTQSTKIFRSSIWSKDGELLSAGFPKFTNFGENPENFPVPKFLNGCKILDKIDGSLCILDWVNSQISMRTRGTCSYNTMENHYDFDYCLQKYPNIKTWLRENSKYSLLFEIVTPNLKIVLDYGHEPDFILIGAVDKTDYSLMNQSELDKIASFLGTKRPKYYSFNNLAELLSTIEKMKDVEGVCLYSNGDQTIHKIKTEYYLKLHYFKSNATYENTVDLFFEFGMPEYKKFEELLIQKFDYECFEMVRGFLSIICDGMKEVNKIVEEMKIRVIPLRSGSRKDAADKIFQMWGKETNRSGFAFKLFDNKELGKEELKKLLYQTTKQ